MSAEKRIYGYLNIFIHSTVIGPILKINLMTSLSIYIPNKRRPLWDQITQEVTQQLQPEKIIIVHIVIIVILEV